MDCVTAAASLRGLLVSYGNADKQVSLLGKLTLFITAHLLSWLYQMVKHFTAKYFLWLQQDILLIRRLKMIRIKISQTRIIL